LTAGERVRMDKLDLALGGIIAVIVLQVIALIQHN